MNSPVFALPDAERSRLRAIVATIEREISRVPQQITAGDSKKPTNGLHASWADLVEVLALGPESAVRECPVCLSPPTERDGVVG